MQIGDNNLCDLHSDLMSPTCETSSELRPVPVGEASVVGGKYPRGRDHIPAGCVARFAPCAVIGTEVFFHRDKT